MFASSGGKRKSQRRGSGRLSETIRRVKRTLTVAGKKAHESTGEKNFLHRLNRRIGCDVPKRRDDFDPREREKVLSRKGILPSRREK